MKAIDWIKSRVAERTSWDGGVVIAVSILALIASPIIKWVAIAGIVYGVWTIWWKED